MNIHYFCKQTRFFFSVKMKINPRAFFLSKMLVADKIDEIVKDLNLPYKLKEQQMDILSHSVRGKNTFGILPTGFGKSDCFGLHHLLMSKVREDKPNPMTLVMSPLRSLQINQVQRWRTAGVKAAGLTSRREMTKEDLQGLENGDFDVIFSSPEVVTSLTWWPWLQKNKKRITLLALDEVHCLSKWGKTFRPEYLEVVKLRSIVTCPMMLLTATATRSIITEILTILHLKETDMEMIAHIPDRPNIHLSLARTDESFEQAFKEYLDTLKNQKEKAPKAIIYSQSISSVTEIWGWLNAQLGYKNPDTRLCEMYHASTDHTSQTRITTTLPQLDSHIRCVVATVAFGLGIDLPDVEYVFHWGVPSDIMSYWQEVGRCGRDGRAGQAKLFIIPRSLSSSRVDEEFIDLIKKAESGLKCLRSGILEHLFVRGMDREKLASCSNIAACCIVCDKKNN